MLPFSTQEESFLCYIWESLEALLLHDPLQLPESHAPI